MSNVQEYAYFLKQHFHPQLVIPELANQVGLAESIVLQQIHYWLEKSGKIIDGEVWIYNTFDQWQQQFVYWSISKIKRVFYSLEKAGFIISRKINVRKSNHTKWYSLNYEKLSSLMAIALTKKAPKEKKFNPIKNELSLCQIDTIINTKTNYTNILSLSNEKAEQKALVLNQPSKQLDRKNEFFYLGNEEKKICQKMLEVWYGVFFNSKEKIVLTPKRETKLYRIWSKICNQDMEKWREICLAINSSKFLMGEKESKFKAYFDWIIGEKTINRILAGEFNIGDRIPDIKQAEMEIKAKQDRQLCLAKLEEERAKQQEARHKLEAERIAQRLAAEELEKVEAGWDESDQEKARKAFEDFLSRGGEGNPYFKDISKSYQQSGKLTYMPTIVDFFFNEFKILTYLEKSWDEFLKDAEMLLESKQTNNRGIDAKIDSSKPQLILCEVKNKEITSTANEIIAECKDAAKDLEFELEIVARQLAEEELAAIEATWTNVDKEKAVDEFEDFLLRGGDKDPCFAYIVDNFRKRNWIQQNKTLVESYFQEFKIVKYLKKNWESFKTQAKIYNATYCTLLE